MKPLQWRSNAGFTLMEVMIVVVIMAVLVTIALPVYENNAARTWQQRAASCLSVLAHGMERRFTGQLTYAGPTATPDILPPAACVTEDGMSQRYVFNFTATPTASDFTLRAVPQGIQAQRMSQCGTLSINQTGTRAITGGGDLERCW